MEISYKYTKDDVLFLGTYGSIAVLTVLLERLRIHFQTSVSSPIYLKYLDNITRDYWYWLIQRPSQDELFDYYQEGKNMEWTAVKGAMGCDYFYYTYYIDFEIELLHALRYKTTKSKEALCLFMDIQLFNLMLLESYDRTYPQIQPRMNANTADIRHSEFFNILKKAVALADNPTEELVWQHRVLDKAMDAYGGVPYWKVRIERDFLKI